MPVLWFAVRNVQGISPCQLVNLSTCQLSLNILHVHHNGVVVRGGTTNIFAKFYLGGRIFALLFILSVGVGGPVGVGEDAVAVDRKLR